MPESIQDSALSQYFDAVLSRHVVKIKPGEFFATTRPFVIATVLGSCVSACLRDPARGSAGMNHFMLPDQGPQARDAGESSLRYGVFAMESLINEFIKHGSQRRDIEAKVFGGGAVMEQIHTNVGAQNATFVVDYLAVEGIRVVVKDLGGLLPRKVLFFVEDGSVRVKYLKSRANDPVELGEAEYARSLAWTLRPAPVELF